VLAVYAALFATGYWIYGRTALAAALTLVSLGAAVALARIWGSVAGRSGAGAPPGPAAGQSTSP
jgi:hypothetical protein